MPLFDIYNSKLIHVKQSYKNTRSKRNFPLRWAIKRDGHGIYKNGPHIVYLRAIFVCSADLVLLIDGVAGTNNFSEFYFFFVLFFQYIHRVFDK